MSEQKVSYMASLDAWSDKSIIEPLADAFLNGPEEAVVSNDDIVKGYQHAPDQYVLVTPDEIASIKPKSNESIEIIGFLTPKEIPTTYFDASYFAAPNGAAASKAYALLREVMKRTGLIAIGKVILREREDLLTISPEGDGLILQKLHYRHEVASRSLTDLTFASFSEAATMFAPAPYQDEERPAEFSASL
jgi:DNA end-binding protein Ku